MGVKANVTGLEGEALLDSIWLTQYTRREGG